jgi:hypothetical protein
VHRAATIEPLDHRGDRVPHELTGLLADRGQVHVRQPGQRAVVEADDGDLTRHGDPAAQQRIEQADRAVVVVGNDRGRIARV